MALRSVRSLALAATVAFLPLGAQEVRGRALAPGSTAPVSGVIATLVDSTGFVVDRILTSGTGAFRLRATRPGLYHIRALRIGFRPSESPTFLLAAGQVVERSIELTSRTVTLAAVQVAAERSCTVRPDSSSSAFEAWEEARTALAAAMLTRDRRYTMEVVRFERRLSPRGGAVLAETEVEGRAVATRPFVSVPLARLDSTGYVQEEGEWITFRAPDEEVLLSEQFAATHCLRLAQPDADDEVSLAFEPVGERTMSDIRGTLALDRATGALRRLDFTFANVASEIQREKAGGQVFFRPLPQGGWIVYRWALRFPMFERVVAQQQAGRLGDIRAGNLRRAESIELRAIQETGGEVTEVARGDSILWQVERPRLTGLVRDDHGAPVAGATVTIPTLGRVATTGADGRFTMRDVRRGRRLLLVFSPLIDSLGLTALARDADMRTGDDVALTIPARGALFTTACRLPAEESRDVGFVRGTTRGGHGERLGRVRIVVRWFQGSGATLDPRIPGVMRTIETASSATGDFAICGVPLDQRITFTAWIAGERAGETSAVVRRESRILMVDLPVGTRAFARPR